MPLVVLLLFLVSSEVFAENLLSKIRPIGEFNPSDYSLSELVTPKDKFEKSEDYDIRIKLLSSSLDHRFVSSYEIKSHYDADLEQYVFQDNCIQSMDNEEINLVRTLFTDQATIELTCNSSSFTVPMPIDEAKKNDKFIKGSVVYSVFPQTINDDMVFKGSMEEFVVINTNTGEQIFQSIKAQQLPLEICEEEMLENVVVVNGKTPAMRNKFYEKFQSVQKVSQMGDLVSAEELLDEIFNDHQKKAKKLFGSSSEMNSYELANYYNLRAYVAYTKNDYASAIKAYQELIRQPDIPYQLFVNTNYSLAQLYIVSERPVCAVEALTHWFSIAENPNANSYALLAKIHFNLQNFNDASKYLSLGIEKLRKENKEIPKALLVLGRDIEYYLRNDEAYNRFNKQLASLPAEEKFNPDDGLPIVKVAPIYPKKASINRIEGHCVVEFSVAKDGSVKNPRAIDCSPSGYFEEASVKAAAKFKYKPRIIDGKPVEVQGVQNKFTYTLN